MIIVALGSNLPSPHHGAPQAVLEAALEAISAEDLRVVKRSRWYRSAPQPPSGQPWFVNGAAQIETSLPPGALLARLHEVEADFGRYRGEPNSARILDLDLLAYQGLVTAEGDPLRLPHPRLHERAFVVLPIMDLDPDWRHPILGLTANELIDRLPEDQEIYPVDEEA